MSLCIRLFGTMHVEVDGQPLPHLRTRKVAYLLAFLSLRKGAPLAREALAGTLWPDSVDTKALFNLRLALSELRHALGERASCIVAPEPRQLALATRDVVVDVWRFDDAVAGGELDPLREAVSLYAGPLLADCSEVWALPERTAREQAYLSALETLARGALDAGDVSGAIASLRRLLLVDPHRESAVCSLMEALAASGDYASAVQVYRDLRLALYREMSMEPAAATRALFLQLQGKARAVAEPRAKAAVATPVVRRLPVPLTRLIGREEDVQAVAMRLIDSRLVALTGSGGVGKTRLAIRVADVAAEDFVDGVWFTDLTPLADPSLMVSTIARSLGLKEEPSRTPWETLTAFLAPRSLLLVLDNCEHLLPDSARLVGELLAACPHLHLLATTRQVLGVPGEVAYRVPSLAVPPVEAGPMEKVLATPSVELFIERATQAQPQFRLAPGSIDRIARICRRLEGIPLALELAAARVRSLSLEQIATRLEDRFAVLTGGNDAALPRHQTLEATLDWSYDLLSAEEQTLLRRLSVFAGGWTLEAAEQVCGDDPAGAEA